MGGLLASLFVIWAALVASAAAQDLDLLSRQINSGNSEQKRDALLVLRSLRTAEASRVAVPALHDGEEVVRATAAGSVVFLPPAEAASALTPLLADNSAFVRKEAAYALGEGGDPSSAPPLISLLSDKDLEVRAAAANALGRIGRPAAVDPLLSILRKSPAEESEFIRRSAARSIGQIAEFVYTGRIPLVIPQNYLPEQYKVIKPADKNVTAQFDGVGAVMLRVFQNDRESEDTRREAAFALGSLRYRPAEPVLSASLGTDDAALNEIAREALLKLKALE